MFDSKSLRSLFWTVNQRTLKTSWNKDHSHISEKLVWTLVWLLWYQPKISQQLFKNVPLGKTKNKNQETFKSDVQKHYVMEEDLNIK